MSKYPPQYDELYVVSDIHMGGRKAGSSDFQIFNRGQRLANLVRYIAGKQTDRDVALVLNGDIIDSLAEDLSPDYVALDVDTALRMMDRIYADPSFKPVWDAFAELVHTQRRALVFVVGNHDIELGLPAVEASVRAQVSRGDVAADARIIFATHGGGFGCTVGSSRVFCTHGNEVDGWNTVDYSQLGLLANAMNAGRRPDPARWSPNAGTRLVVDVMNKVKKQYPFVDLLKPETKPVLATLLTLDPELLKRVDFGSAFPILREKVRGTLETRNLLSAGQDLSAVASDQVAAAAVQEILGSSLAEKVDEARRDASGASEDALLLNAERALNDPGATNATATPAQEGTLGVGDIVASWFGLVDKVEGLRRALDDWLQDDKTFDITQPDDTYTAVIDRVGPEVDFVVTGHTHLAREIKVNAKRYYYNCGTWIRLLRLTKEVLSDPGAFKERCYRALAAGTMDALDQATIPGPEGRDVDLVFDRTNVVHIADENGATTSALLRVKDGAQSGSVDLVAEAEADKS